MKPAISLSELPDHHAVLVVSGERDAVGVTLFEELQKISPAHRLFDQTVLDIDTARNIISWANTPWSGEKIALITFHTATIPAQNAMLKVLEEPKAGVKFILLTSNKEHLLGTVLSRVQYVEQVVQSKRELDSRAVTFLATKYSERMKLAFVTQLLVSEDEEGRKDREKIRGFILSLSQVLSEKNAEPKFILETIEVASFAGDSSASGKALIEYLSLLLPVVKD